MRYLWNMLNKEFTIEGLSVPSGNQYDWMDGSNDGSRNADLQIFWDFLSRVIWKISCVQESTED